MLSATFLLALGSVANALLLVAGLYIYVSLIRQISGRRSTSPNGSTTRFGLPEAVLAAGLTFLLLFGVLASVSKPSVQQFNGRVLVENLLFTLGIVLVVVAFLRLRGFDLNLLGGFSQTSFLRALSTGTILMLAAYPLIALADAITQRLLGSGSSKQSIVELFNGSRTIEQRIIIIIFAVVVAPAAEEFLFRFFLYGVLKRFFGRFFGLTANALLFAAVHTHLPSFAPLFVLGSCFTIAYEWSGSILVSMTMHALFNSVSLTLLAFPELFSR
jgi:membrane protease YdiL (CAAX protease family)